MFGVEFNKDKLIVKGFFVILFSTLFMVLSQTKLTPIFGTNTKYSAALFFGPVLSSLLGPWTGVLTILLSQFFGVIINLYQAKSLLNLLVFFPILGANLYLFSNFKDKKKFILVPIGCIIAFLLHPIGRKVWSEVFFWFIPIFIIQFRDRIEKHFDNPIPKTYTYSLGAAFVDHGIGSVIYLYTLNIPKKFWLQAMPLVPIERMIIAGGITLTYFLIKRSLKTLKRMMVPEGEVIPEEEKEKLKTRIQ